MLKRISVNQAIAGLILLMAFSGLATGRAEAVPAFEAQTGAPCQACHVGGFGPQLTPFGRDFKMRGYVLRTNPFTVPLSAMAMASYIHTAKRQDPPPDGFHANDNVALDQISLFFAGGWLDHIGAFVQATYDGVAKAWSWDNLDVRATTTAKLGRSDVVLGTSLNNSPTLSDPWNTLPAWGYAYTGSDVAPSPSASPLLSGALAQTSLGLTAYAWINSSLYLEAGGYVSPSAHTLTSLGADPTSPGDIHGVAPYLRAAVQTDLAKGTFEAGGFAMRTDLYPGLDRTTGFTDRYSDWGLDTSYVHTVRGSDTVTLNARYLHEDQDLQATCALAAAPPGACDRSDLTDLRADVSYYWRDKIGATVQAFDTFGSANPYAYADNRTLKPDSSGIMLQLDVTPWGDSSSPLGRRFNTRLGVQYTAYARFDGAAHNYDGLGHNAADNDTVRVFTWIAF